MEGTVMATAREVGSSVRPLLLLATLMAIATAVAYLAIGFGLVPDDFSSPLRPVMVFAGVTYVVGAGVLHLVGRRLLLLGAAANAAVLGLFVLSAARENATVDVLSLSAKSAQVILSVLLVWAGLHTAPRR